jgi:hypothetical protein
MSSLVGPACRVHTVSVCRAGLRMGRLDRLWPGKFLSSLFSDLFSFLFFYFLFCFILTCISNLFCRASFV